MRLFRFKPAHGSFQFNQSISSLIGRGIHHQSQVCEMQHFSETKKGEGLFVSIILLASTLFWSLPAALESTTRVSLNPCSIKNNCLVFDLMASLPCVLTQDSLRNPKVKSFIDRALEDTPFSSHHILDFLYNGPAHDRPDRMAPFDWRDVFNLTDRVVHLLNQYGDVSGASRQLRKKSKRSSYLGFISDFFHFLFIFSWSSSSALASSRGG